jgi:uncharacterized protein YdiU (UPF0061 family)
MQQRNPRAEARQWIARAIAHRTETRANTEEVKALAAALENTAAENGIAIEAAVEWCAFLTTTASLHDPAELARQFKEEQQS